MAIRCVLFDLDETLNDRGLSWLRFVREVLASPEEPLLKACPTDKVHQMILEADRGGYRPKEELFGELSARLDWNDWMDAERLEALWRERFPECMVARTGAHQVLQNLRARGLKLGIVTNGRADMQRSKVDAMGLGPLVDAVVISEDVGAKKPQPAIFQWALDQLGVDARETLFVGDNPRADIWGAAQLGMRTAWVSNQKPWPQELTQADWTVADLEEVEKLTGSGQ